MRISDWSSDVCSPELRTLGVVADKLGWTENPAYAEAYQDATGGTGVSYRTWLAQLLSKNTDARLLEGSNILEIVYLGTNPDEARLISGLIRDTYLERSEEHTSELQSLMRISYAVFCLKKKKTTKH